MPSVLVDKSREPTSRELAAALGKAHKSWELLLAHLSAQPGIVVAWKFYGAKLGWQLKAAQGKRAVLYLVPNEGAFVAAMALRPAALELARSSLPAALVREIDAARPGPEGHPARVRVTTAKDLGVVKQLLAIKLSR
jgi:hypothetical protein